MNDYTGSLYPAPPKQEAPEPLKPRKRRTAAYEALVICRKFYPWRVNGYLRKPVSG